MYLGRIMEIAPSRELYQQPQAPLHRGAAVGGSDPRPHRQARAHHSGRRYSQPDQPAEWLRVPYPLPLRDCRVRQRDSRTARSGPEPLQSLYPRRYSVISLQVCTLSLGRSFGGGFLLLILAEVGNVLKAEPDNPPVAGATPPLKGRDKSFCAPLKGSWRRSRLGGWGCATPERCSAQQESRIC